MASRRRLKNPGARDDLTCIEEGEDEAHHDSNANIDPTTQNRGTLL